MNTQKQVLIMSVLLMMSLIVVAVYAAWYPNRSEDAEAHFEEATAERGAMLFARNCRLCHGDAGQGGLLGGKLAAAPGLDRPDLQGFENSEAVLTAEVNPTATTIEVSDGAAVAPQDVILIDSERMLVTGVAGTTVTVQRAQEHTETEGHFPDAAIWVFDEAILEEHVDLLTNTITCGRVGTAMPPWAQSQSGPLSDEQIRQLTVLITTSSWDLVEEEAAIEDQMSASLTAPVDAETTDFEVTDVTAFTADDAIRIGEERIRVVELPEVEEGATGVPGTITVERGILNSFAEEHTPQDQVYRFAEPAEPAVTEQSCGQTASAPVETGPCEETDGVVQIGAVDTTFTCSEIQAAANSEVTVALENQESVAHNIAFYETDAAEAPLADGAAVGPTFSGPDTTEELSFQSPDAGEYFFRCDVHPVQMTGAFVVE